MSSDTWKDLAPPEEIDLDRLRAFRFAPDDVIVMEYDDDMSVEAAQKLQEWMSAAVGKTVPKRQVLVLSGGLKIFAATGKISPGGDYVVNLKDEA